MTTSSSRAEGDLVVKLEPTSTTTWYWYTPEKAIVSQYPGSTREQHLEHLVACIKDHKPARIFMVVGDREHKLSSQTLKAILEGKMTPADITAG